MRHVNSHTGLPWRAVRTERLRHQGLPPEPAASSFTSAPLLQRTVKKGEYKEDITDYSRLGLSNGSNGATAPVAGLASPARFYDPDITTHGEVRECFLTPDGRGQLVVEEAQPQMIKFTPYHPHTQQCHWLEWFPWAFFLSILVLVSGMLSTFLSVMLSPLI